MNNLLLYLITLHVHGEVELSSERILRRSDPLRDPYGKNDRLVYGTGSGIGAEYFPRNKNLKISCAVLVA